MQYSTAKPSVKEVTTLSGRQLSSKKWTKSQRAAFAAIFLEPQRPRRA